MTCVTGVRITTKFQGADPIRQRSRRAWPTAKRKSPGQSPRSRLSCGNCANVEARLRYCRSPSS